MKRFMYLFTVTFFELSWQFIMMLITINTVTFWKKYNRCELFTVAMATFTSKVNFLYLRWTVNTNGRILIMAVPLTKHIMERKWSLHDIKNCKSRALSRECYLDFIAQSIDEISHLSSLRHYLHPLKGRVRQAQFLTVCQFQIYNWTAFWYWIHINYPFDRSTIYKWRTTRFNIDSAIAIENIRVVQ